MAIVQTQELRKEFGHNTAVDGINLETEEGEYLVLLGPSGCGKTTLLRLIAGLEQPTGGDVLIGGEVVTRLPPRARKIAMVFQSYALYPHKTVRKNIAFPLAAARVPKEEWHAQGRLGRRRARHRPAARPQAAPAVRRERQRVALARALVREPQVFLLDEPLSNLDAKLRASARDELQGVPARVGITTIYVTHDQVEAMGLGDRIAVLNDGQIQQLGTPEEIYDRPGEHLRGDVLGAPPMNLRARRDGSCSASGRSTCCPCESVGERRGPDGLRVRRSPGWRTSAPTGTSTAPSRSSTRRPR